MDDVLTDDEILTSLELLKANIETQGKLISIQGEHIALAFKSIEALNTRMKEKGI